MTDAPAPAPSVANPDLVRLHGQLVALVARLDAAIGDARTAGQVIAITDAITAVNARVTAVGRQLLTRQAATLTRLTTAIDAAIPEVERAIAGLDDLKALVDGITDFLRSIDQIVAAAKLVG